MLATAAQGPRDPAFRIRLELPLEAALNGNADRVQYVPLFTQEEAQRVRTAARPIQLGLVAAARRRTASRLRRAEASTLVVQRRIDPLPTLGMERTAARGRRLILDVDDAVWLTGQQAGTQPLARLTRPGAKAAWLASRADTVIAGNDILAEWLSKWSSTVTVIPSLVDTEQYAPREHRDTEVFTICWIGSRTTQVYLERLTAVLPSLAQAVRKPVRLITVGGHMTPGTGWTADSRAWSVGEEQRVLGVADVGVMPLADTGFARGKCGYKAIQYMAAGLPVVADDVGLTEETLGPGGVVVRSVAEWIEALTALAGDPALRQETGRRGRRQVEERFSISRWTPTYREILGRNVSAQMSATDQSRS